MPTNEIAPTVQEADQRVERAKASLLSRVEALKDKLSDARHTLDLPAQIAKHPLPAVGIAFTLGALVALQRTRPPAPVGPLGGSVKNAAFAALTALGLRILRNVALDELGQFAKQWWTGRRDRSRSQVAASSAAEVEPFLEH